MVDRVRALSPEDRRRIRIYSGHLPFAVAKMVQADFTLTILRDPLERTLSLLRQLQRNRARMRAMSLEEIYDDPMVFGLLIHNYQSKLFAMTLDDKLESHLDVLDVDDARLEVAFGHLESVDVLGLTNAFGCFTEELRRRFGWRIGDVRDRFVDKSPSPASASLRSRIVADNQADIAFYDRARQIVERRARAQ